METLHIVLPLISSIISSVITWSLAKRKYNAEVDNQEIQNLKESLEFYKEIIESNNVLIAEYTAKVEESMLEIHRLRSAVSELLAMSCVDAVCKKRKLLPRSEAEGMLKDTSKNERTK